MAAKSPTANLNRCDWLDGARRELAPASIDFLYADPPFNTGSSKLGLRGSSTRYRDSWPSIAAYVDWLRERVEATLPSLKRSGIVALHVDYRTSHRVRVMLDELLGEDRFVNHLIWSYGLGGSSPRRFARKHDDIIVYCLDPRRYFFAPPMVPATSRRLAGKLKKSTDVLDIPSINNMAAERTGYPTQKPLALLELLVGAFCPPGGTVLDPCCGSGTTVVAALRLGRHAVGFDINPDAVSLSRQRASAAAHETPADRNQNNDPSPARSRATRPGTAADAVE